jgi:AcrR family transcriptional regulator
MVEARRRGRPRSEPARRAILDAALAELEDRGYAALTIEGIAARAGVGKQTIYRWWPSKADVVLDALLELARERVRTPDTGSLAEDLKAFLAATFRARGPRPILVGLMAQAQFDPAFAVQFRERFLFARRAALRSIFERARQRGELGADVDVEVLLDVVFGVLWYRMLVDHVPLRSSGGVQLAELILRAIGAVPR